MRGFTAGISCYMLVNDRSGGKAGRGRGEGGIKRFMGRLEQAQEPAPSTGAAARTLGGRSQAPARALRGQDWRRAGGDRQPSGLTEPQRASRVCHTEGRSAVSMCHGDRLTAPRVAAARPGRSGSPAAVLVEPCVGQHEERAPDADHRDLPRRSLRNELTVLRAQVRVVTDRRQGQAYGAAGGARTRPPWMRLRPSTRRSSD